MSICYQGVSNQKKSILGITSVLSVFVRKLKYGMAGIIVRSVASVSERWLKKAIGLPNVQGRTPLRTHMHFLLGLKRKHWRTVNVWPLHSHLRCLGKTPIVPEVESPLAAAMDILKKALKEDDSPGSYYYGWQSNIACTIMDNSSLSYDKANDIAKKFLNLLIS
jgi:hypothetical protein